MAKTDIQQGFLLSQEMKKTIEDEAWAERLSISAFIQKCIEFYLNSKRGK